MAGVTGLEPATSGVTGRRSNQLSYTPAEAALRQMPGWREGRGVLRPLRPVKETPGFNPRPRETNR